MTSALLRNVLSRDLGQGHQDSWGVETQCMAPNLLLHMLSGSHCYCRTVTSQLRYPTNASLWSQGPAIKGQVIWGEFPVCLGGDNLIWKIVHSARIGIEAYSWSYICKNLHGWWLTRTSHSINPLGMGEKGLTRCSKALNTDKCCNVWGDTL